ncbi:carboxylesterase/lipase family protein [Hyalangium rubrum]|uniref:Carboxylic ester hydrolase n=1 Tax=Hyalangium rubrum TaxID=3103134 RepID=A0ABU5H4H1_9BACT|nr:carboxylesterase/lipase family protein [Hyalangium sp. s54d21]MDY7228363.1 carboxylesterase/lipase family protein [Hyalangium sp. s54d21]
MANEKTPEVQTQEGPVQGIVENDVFVFKGIPYAKPPVDDLRWRPPAPVTPWTQVHAADKYGPSSYQNAEECKNAGGGDPGTLSEDCLYLNVWTPKFAAGAPPSGLPVMVWIHGGAYVLGAGGLPPYVGSPLVKKGAIVVTLNYRLGALGFFSHPALDAENAGKPINNFGLLDQIAALQWVQRNISRFGGDPNNVTIFGQSAGGKSVLALFCTPMARGLFHKGVAQSVYGLSEMSQANARKRGVNLATLAGLKGENATAQELRDLEADSLWSLTPEDAKETPVSNAPVAIYGDQVLSESLADTFRKGTEAPLPLILGSTSNDSSVVLAFGVEPVKVIENLRKNLIFVGPLYPDIKNDDAELGRQVCRDLLFTVVPRLIAQQHSQRAPSWRYYFDYTAVERRPEKPTGVDHGSDIPYMFGTCEMCPPNAGHFNQEDRAFQEKVVGYWFEFARSGQPTAQTSTEWPAHTKDQDSTMLLAPTTEAKADFMKGRLDIFAALGNLGNIIS